MPPAGSPFRVVAGGLEVQLKVTPKAAHERIEDLKPTADGGVRLAVKVTAPPDKGKANQAVVRLLAGAWSLPGSRLAVIAGVSDRNKTLLIAGADAELKGRLDRWLAERKT